MSTGPSLVPIETLGPTAIKSPMESNMLHAPIPQIQYASQLAFLDKQLQV
jgi:hypothetical protein